MMTTVKTLYRCHYNKYLLLLWFVPTKCLIVVLQKGFTPLHEAARNGHVRIVEILLKSYDNPDPEGKVSESVCFDRINKEFKCSFYSLMRLLVRKLACWTPVLIERPRFKPWPESLCFCSWARHFTLTVPLSTQPGV